MLQALRRHWGFGSCQDPPRCLSPPRACMARRYQDVLGGGRAEPRCPGVQSHDAEAAAAPAGTPELWGCRDSGPAPGPAGARPGVRGKLKLAERVSAGQTGARSDTASPGDREPGGLTQLLCGPVMPSPPAEVFSGCTGRKTPATPAHSSHSSHSWDGCHSQPLDTRHRTRSGRLLPRRAGREPARLLAAVREENVKNVPGGGTSRSGLGSGGPRSQPGWLRAPPPGCE